jgi:16S rRNA C967 or C1407 C5-methylase (RsmB/RsmF family)
MFFPSNHLKKLATALFGPAPEHETFLQSLADPPVFPTAVIWLEERPNPSVFPTENSYTWQPDFVDCVSIEHRPGRHLLHEQGAYYCLDVSSVFAASVLEEVPERPEVVLDLCASPGGKSVFAWRLLRPRLLLANEVIGKRTAALIANLRRCRIHPAALLSRDSSILADTCPHTADLVIVDAPCSGQSLIARGKPSPGCFHPATINMNANRQRRILACATRVVAPGGYLAYLTCTYAQKENETNAKWLMKRFPQLQPVAVPKLAAFQSHLADFPCYRLWPQQGIGAGAFAVLFRYQISGTQQPLRLQPLRPVWRSSGPSDAGFDTDPLPVR